MIYNNSNHIEITQWLNILTRLHIPFYIYKLYQNDSIIYKPEHLQKRKLIILKGTVFLQKIFHNNEHLCIAILYKNTLINSYNNCNYINQSLYYYRIISLSTTYIISLPSCSLLNNCKNQYLFLLQVSKSYHLSLIAYEHMIHILAHKYTKYRIIQLLLFLCKEEGVPSNNKILIKLPINQFNMGQIVGSNKNTIHKVIQSLQKYKIIKYFKHNQIIIINDIIALNKFKFAE